MVVDLTYQSQRITSNDLVRKNYVFSTFSKSLKWTKADAEHRITAPLGAA
jgi:hypothetical protein